MQCPNCALYHPPRYEQCVSCGAKLVADGELVPQAPAAVSSPGRGSTMPPPPASRASARDNSGKEKGKAPGKRGMPTALGIIVAGFILFASAGGTIFYLTKPPENQRLLKEGQKQLQLGQYAFALKTLSQAVKMKPDDPKALLCLARAYVGVDQVDKAWDCIVQAQQLGAGVMAEPQLASDLANYYRQHQQYQRAVELLRPLAAASVGGKRAELADLDAAWGDKCFDEGDFRQAMHCWEEVKDMHEGSRFNEADTRLATIYQKMAEDAARKGDDDDALKFYERLNTMAPSAVSYERTAELYQKEDKLDLSIDQMRKAVKLAGENQAMNRKLAAVMAARGKELLDGGDVDAGYGYLQQAQVMDSKIKAPPSVVRDIRLELEPGTGILDVSGFVWNPGPDAVNELSVRGELFDNKTGRQLWAKDLRLIDEFVPPMQGRDSRAFDFKTGVAPPVNTSEFRIYLNGTLYRTYALSKLGKEASAAGAGNPVGNPDQPTLRPRITPAPSAPPVAPASQLMPVPAAARVDQHAATPSAVPAPIPSGLPAGSDEGSGPSPEEKTLKDLD